MIFWSSYPDFPYKKAFPENHKKGGSKELQKRFRVVVTRDFRGLLPPLCIRVISDPRWRYDEAIPRFSTNIKLIEFSPPIDRLFSTASDVFLQPNSWKIEEFGSTYLYFQAVAIDFKGVPGGFRGVSRSLQEVSRALQRISGAFQGAGLRLKDPHGISNELPDDLRGVSGGYQ